MNVNDIESEAPEIKPGDCRFVIIGVRQELLMKRYDIIETKNGFVVPSWPVNLDDRFDQQRLKDLAWRVTEELTEATEARFHSPEDLTHCREELADAFHFLIELSLTAGLTRRDIINNLKMGRIEGSNTFLQGCLLKTMFREVSQKQHGQQHLNVACYKLIEDIGKAMNCLKNKPWKQTHLITDKPKFIGHLCNSFLRMADCSLDLGMDADQFYKMYFKKSEVNKFRIESNY